MSQEIDTDWETLFLWNETPYFGYCSSVDEAEDLVEEYSYRTSTSFVVTLKTSASSVSPVCPSSQLYNAI